MSIGLGMKHGGSKFRLCIAFIATILELGSPARGQTPEEHAKHHPAPGGATPAPAGASAPGAMPMPGGGSPAPMNAGAMGPSPAAGGGGMGAGMGEMMKQMGVPPRKELYPSLMALPNEVTPAERAGIEQLADERMRDGVALLSSGLQRLSDSNSGGDYASMQQAAAQMRAGLAEFEAGIAARRVLSEGKAPRNLALDWFKREMNLASPVRVAEPRMLFGVTPFHFFTMALLVAFASAMLAMYFFKMRRAAALFGRLDPDTKPPPPGASPPLAGGPGPPSPAAPPGKGPPSGGTPPASRPPAPSSAAPPAAQPGPTGGTPAAPVTSSAAVPGKDAAVAAEKPSAAPAGGPSPASPPIPPATPGGDEASIAGLAGELWLARGRPMGSPEIDWARAKSELGKKTVDAPPPAVSPAGPETGKRAAVDTPVKAASAAPVSGNSNGGVKAAETPSTTPAAGGSPASPATPEEASAPPVIANWRGQLRVGSIVTESPGVKTFRLLAASGDRLLPFTFVPGQFLNLAFWIGGAKMNRSYSISSSPTQREYVDLTVRREPRGAVSRHIDDLLKVGDQVDVGGPIGKFVFTGTEADSIVLISAGVGITPMMSVTRFLTERSWAGDVYFIYTCRTPADFIFADEIAALQRRNPNLHVAVTISKPEGTDWNGARGRITKEWLTQTVPHLASRRIHLCGPPSMMDAIKAFLTELGVPPDRLKTEAFGAIKPAPAPAGTTANPPAAATGPLVKFSKNGKSAKIHVDQTILELSEDLGIGIEFSCRVGTCGLCKVKMTSGEVAMEVEDALEPDDKTNGIILACQAKPKGEVAVEA